MTRVAVRGGGRCPVAGRRLMLAGLLTLCSATAPAQDPRGQAFLSITAKEKAIAGHVSQQDIEAGLWDLRQLHLAGERLFLARFTRLDGVGRPGATGGRFPTPRAPRPDGEFSRAFGPDASSCFSCHNSPGVGGAGDFAANGFTGLPARDPPVPSVDRQFSNERGTPELNGSAAIELVAREMSFDLHRLRQDAIRRAKKIGGPTAVRLVTKGVDFGELRVDAEGGLNFDHVEGVDHDLVIKPFGQKGVFVSLRDFTVTASNIHHGMQGAERFGEASTGVADFDRDGVQQELTTGDITALTIFQASMNVPGVVVPAGKQAAARVAAGEALFSSIGCAACHVPELPLESTVFIEPNPFNPPTLYRADPDNHFSFDLATEPPTPRILKNAAGRFVVRAFTDLKRHVISDPERPFFHNETLEERFVPTDQFLTRRLWAAGNTGPYGHRGDLTTIEEAILHHGGEANDSRSRYEQLTREQRDSIVDFLTSMQVVPDGAAAVSVVEPEEQLPYRGAGAFGTFLRSTQAESQAKPSRPPF